jgi:hypothetical protein
MALRRDDQEALDERLRQLQRANGGRLDVRNRAAAGWSPRAAAPIEQAGAFERRLEAVKARRQSDAAADGDLPPDPYVRVEARKFSPGVIVQDLGPVILFAVACGVLAYVVTSLALMMLTVFYWILNTTVRPAQPYSYDLPDWIPLAASLVFTLVGFWMGAARYRGLR